MIQPGSKMGRYTISNMIGTGGFSEVYLASDSDLGRRVCIKIAPDIYSKNEEFESSILSEARTLAQIPHPSIVLVFDVGWYNDNPYFVMEYLERSLEDELRRPSRFPAPQAASLTANISDALDYVHRRGFLHRNLKPGVILLDPIGQPKLLGFEAAISKDTILSAQVAGTPYYMAPEQFLNEDLGDHTDIWGLGVTFYQILTGQVPFQSSNGTWELIETIMKTAPVPPSKLSPSIPEELERICLKCLSKEISSRYATADQLAIDLRAWQKTTKQAVKPRVFISHATKDRVFVEQEIISLLEEQGLKTWYSKANIETASEWDRSILRGLGSCEWFILVMSPNAASSDWVRDEVYWAIENRPQRIVPVLIADCDPRQLHIRLGRIQHVDFRSEFETARQKLLNTLEKIAQ
jgi:serine/threonine protein kinase